MLTNETDDNDHGHSGNDGGDGGDNDIDDDDNVDNLPMTQHKNGKLYCLHDPDRRISTCSSNNQIKCWGKHLLRGRGRHLPLFLSLLRFHFLPAEHTILTTKSGNGQRYRHKFPLVDNNESECSSCFRFDELKFVHSVVIVVVSYYSFVQSLNTSEAYCRLSDEYDTYPMTRRIIRCKNGLRVCI